MDNQAQHNPDDGIKKVAELISGTNIAMP